MLCISKKKGTVTQGSHEQRIESTGVDKDNNKRFENSALKHVRIKLTPPTASSFTGGPIGSDSKGSASACSSCDAANLRLNIRDISMPKLWKFEQDVRTARFWFSVQLSSVKGVKQSPSHICFNISSWTVNFCISSPQFRSWCREFHQNVACTCFCNLRSGYAASTYPFQVMANHSWVSWCLFGGDRVQSMQLTNLTNNFAYWLCHKQIHYESKPRVKFQAIFCTHGSSSRTFYKYPGS